MSKRILLFLDDIWRENLNKFSKINYSPYKNYNPISNKIAPYCPTKQDWLEQIYNSYKANIKTNDIVLYIRVDKYDLWI